MSEKYLEKILYKIVFLKFFFMEYLLNSDTRDNRRAEKILKFNNDLVRKKIKKIELKKISILLPHCIQNENCKIKITSEIENCKKCGQCNIGEILKLKEEYKNIGVKVATGGTLARLYLKKEKPNLVIAVACKRDLLSGIKECFPIPVYGILNEIVDSPCINTKVSVKNIKKVLDEVTKR